MYCTNCGKQLSKKSKFCTSCGKKPNTTSIPLINSKNGLNLQTIFYVLWVFTIFLFLISVGLTDLFQPNPTWKPSFLSILFAVNIWLGIASFLAMIVSIVKNSKVKTKRFHKLIFVAMVIFGLTYCSTVAIEGYSKGNLNNLLPSSLQINNKQATHNKVEGAKTSKVPQTSASDSKPTTGLTVKPTINPDPIVSCGPGQYSGQYVKDKQSNCKNYVDCGPSNNSWTLKLIVECDKWLAETTKKNNLNPYPTLTIYPACVVYYPILGYSETYNSTPPDLCQKWKDSAVSSSQIPTQVPTATPVPIPTVDNHTANSNCKFSASQWYNAQLQSANNLFGDSSATQAMQQIALSTYNSMVSDCNNKYPI